MIPVILAAPESTSAGVITATASLFTALALVITAVGAALVNRRTSRRLAENQADTSSRLDVIHTLVNSTLSAALQAQLDASRRELVTMLENVELQQATGRAVSDERKAEVATLRRQVGELSAAMMTRDDQTRYANIQIDEEASRRRWAAEKRGK
jgi:hypothetical protein